MIIEVLNTVESTEATMATINADMPPRMSSIATKPTADMSAPVAYTAVAAAMLGYATCGQAQPQ